MAGFKDHFSRHASLYTRFRPTYPGALFDFLANSSPRRRLAWDCATGGGQAATSLAERFERVVATDASPQQLAEAKPHPRIDYRTATAEASGLQDRSAQLVTVAQAVHWFDLDRFYAEVRRVLAPNGLLAVWCYCHSAISPELDALILHFYRDIVGPYWTSERKLIESGY